ncbi:TetR family transcriptional regulator [Epidermidibacterium keratini]|uniref:TetR family transcriptional regulator n=1 Tax=Epidermidibacterium keratini TaxID=1891644 RepID=A0A7L4YMY9_9ACTN|nr:TetR/AcrR family transcriptional regulator [Epidermidibacterium keratini]QHC00645.1 TetR family transcriptional regulator [Epidermidibacterium keratini]
MPSETITQPDRAQLISAAAAPVLRGRGFSSVGIDEIAAAAGLTGPALYRYFDGKHDVLADVIERFLGELAELTPRAGVDDLSRAVVAHPDAASVAVRQIGLLAPDVRERLLTGVPTQVRALLPLTPEPGEDIGMTVSDRVRLRAIYGAAIHCGLRRSGSLPARTRAAVEAAHALADVPITLDEPEPMPHERLLPLSRREAVMAVAMDLFSQHGYGGVALRDIGAEIGVTASAVSRHFASKEDLLVALFDRAGSQIASSLQAGLRRAQNPRDALERVLRGYSAMALDNRELILIYISERNSLSAANREIRRDNHLGYTAELRQLIELTTGLPRAVAQLRATLAFSVVNEVLFDEPACRHRNLAGVLGQLAYQVATSPAVSAAKGK